MNRLSRKKFDPLAHSTRYAWAFFHSHSADFKVQEKQTQRIKKEAMSAFCMQCASIEVGFRVTGQVKEENNGARRVEEGMRRP